MSCIIIQPNFEKLQQFANGIAMLQLQHPGSPITTIAPICLPNPDLEPPLCASCWITGWGKLN